MDGLIGLLNPFLKKHYITRISSVFFVAPLKMTLYFASNFISLVCFLVDIPELIVLEIKPNRDLRVETIYFMQCTQSWDRKSEMTFLILKILFLYTLPLIFMSITYFQIVRVLWKSDNIPGHQETKKYSSNHAGKILILASEIQNK